MNGDKITVFTPTYNRAHILSNAYRSLLSQTYYNFEWIIVDDGSNDNTCEIVEGWIKEASFTIRYIRQLNQGKHIALNKGIEEAKGEYFLILDSDDILVTQALERFMYYWNTIPDNNRDKFFGLAGLCAYENGEIIGTKFPVDISNYIEIRTKHKVKGDKVEIYRTAVLKKYPLFPQYEGEKFVCEALVWNRIAPDYAMLFFNEVLCIKEYRADGLTAGGALVVIKSPLGARQYFQEYINLPVWLPFDILLRRYGSYIRFSLHAHINLVAIFQGAPSKLILLTMLPLGYAMYFRDKLKYPEKKSEKKE